MAATLLDIDLTFSLDEPPDGGSEPRMRGSMTARGTEVEVYTSDPKLLLAGRRLKLGNLRSIADELARRGLTVALSGPAGLIARLGAIKGPLAQRVVTWSPHIELGAPAVIAPLLAQARRSAGAAAALELPPSTLFPLAPTFDRRPHRRVTTTHYTPGSGRPRLIFAVGSENWTGQRPREFDLLPTVTRIGSSPTSDLQLPGLLDNHAEIVHDNNDEYVFYPAGAAGASASTGRKTGGQILRTGARVELGPWRMAFFREEYADHGRPYGGRAGGELAYQKPQPPRHRTPGGPTD
ncbi:FHA domain-containing protein [Mycetocola zhadangensis]|uniref:FHA domain-containing protein n=1 Tax=Mycetocola zhadangensis TaxID=1164595 RepID=UPI003A4D518F